MEFAFTVTAGDVGLLLGLVGSAWRIMARLSTLEARVAVLWEEHHGPNRRE